MKTGLRALFFMASLLLAISNFSFAQCEVSNIYIQNIRVVNSTSTSCTVKFDVSFDIQNNNGNKYIFFHAWLLNDYPNYFQCVNGHSTLNGAIHAPKSADLQNEFLTVGINNNVDPPTIITTYPPDNSVPMALVDGISRVTNTNGTYTFILTGVTATVPVACGTPVVIMADLWSSQSAQAQVAHCVSCGHAYSSGFLGIAGLANCATRTYNVQLTNNTATAITGVYTVYADINGDGVFSLSTDTAISATTNFTVGAGVGTTTTLTGPIPAGNVGQDLFLVTNIDAGGTGASKVTLIPSTVCSPLPVNFASFNASRVNENIVNLRWQTASEENNSGFAIYRVTGTLWEFVSFVPTQAMGGNSSSLLTYTFSDRNNYKGISQYRIKQVDFDGKAKYSEIRAVRGESVADKVIVYPNPSSDGRVTVLFEDRDGVRDLSLVDNSGRQVKRWSGITGNIIQIDNLQPGLYTLRIMIRETGFQQVQKIVVLRN